MLRKIKILTFSHAYFVAENQKNVHALAAVCDFRCVLPRKLQPLFDHGNVFQCDPAYRTNFFPLRTFQFFRSQYMMLPVSSELISFKPDIINVEYNPWSFMFIEALIYRDLFSPRAKIVCTIKKNTYIVHPSPFGRLKHLVAKWSLNRADHVIAVSGMAKNLLINVFGLSPDKISLCQHLGVDTELFRPQSKIMARPGITEPIVIGYCGRLVEYKGIEDLISAVDMLLRMENCNIRLRMVGEQAPKHWLQIYENKYKLLEILPPISLTSVASFLREVDIFLLPSRNLHDHQEHDAHALLEALAAGLPCIGTKSGIIPEILADGTGLTVETENPKEIAIALKKLIESPETRIQLGLRGRKKAIEHFSLDALAKRRISIFERILNG